MELSTKWLIIQMITGLSLPTLLITGLIRVPSGD